MYSQTIKYFFCAASFVRPLSTHDLVIIRITIYDLIQGLFSNCIVLFPNFKYIWKPNECILFKEQK